jgi:hypothetical protein
LFKWIIPEFKKIGIRWGKTKRASQSDKPPQPQQSKKTAKGIMGKVPPGKCCPNQSTSNKRGADGLENPGIPKLQYFKAASDYKYPNGDFAD